MKIFLIRISYLLIGVSLTGCASKPVRTFQHQIPLVSPRVDTPKIGDHEIRFEKAYGNALSAWKGDFKDYSDGQMKIEVHYYNGIAESILYTSLKGQPLEDYWVSRILSQNSCGRAWVVKRGSKPNDIWYRTPDLKLIANLYKQSKLEVSTNQFRQLLLDQNGKSKMPAEQSKTSVFYPDCACVFLGKSESEFSALLGNPSVSHINANVRIYRDHDVTIRAQFENGRGEAIKYVSTKGKFSDHWVSATLALNSKGLAWVVDEELKRGYKRFVTIDGKLHAVLKQKGHELLLYTEELNQRTIDRLYPDKDTRIHAVSRHLGL